MKTQSDYYSKVLGMSLTHNPDANHLVNKSKEVLVEESIKTNDTVVDQREKFNFLILASSEDIDLQKEMLVKILKALGADFNHVTESLMNKTSDHIFVFGELEAPEESYFFPSLVEVSEDQDLKKELWEEIKVFKK